METIISKPQDSFSFRRVKMVGGYYYPIFKRQLWIYPSLSLAAGILTFLFKYFSEYFGAGFLGGDRIFNRSYSHSHDFYVLLVALCPWQ